VAGASPHTIVNIGYRSTNYWVVSAGRTRLLVDLGWPGTMGTLRANLGRADIPLAEIRYALATHYHPDHAGLAQELKQAGVALIVVDLQVPALARLRTLAKARDGFIDIALHDNVVVTCADSRRLLGGAGIAGEIIHTPGHSDDSVSLVLDDGSAFTGDLTPPTLALVEDAAIIAASWRRLLDAGARRVYPGHGPIASLATGSRREVPHAQ
jgi:glyoxylase-like metal-dependent hydrolase (beta-lactamase superfamily II)